MHRATRALQALPSPATKFPISRLTPIQLVRQPAQQPHSGSHSAEDGRRGTTHPCMWNSGSSLMKRDNSERHKTLRQPRQIWVYPARRRNERSDPPIAFKRDKTKHYLKVRAHLLQEEDLDVAFTGSLSQCNPNLLTVGSHRWQGGYRFRSFVNRSKRFEHYSNCIYPAINVAQYSRNWPDNYEPRNRIAGKKKPGHQATASDPRQNAYSPRTRRRPRRHIGASLNDHNNSITASPGSNTVDQRMASLTYNSLSSQMDFLLRLAAHLRFSAEIWRSMEALWYGTPARVENVAHQRALSMHAGKSILHRQTTKLRPFNMDASIIQLLNDIYPNVRPGQLIRALIAIASGLAYLHNLNMVQNDVQAADTLIHETDLMYIGLDNTTTSGPSPSMYAAPDTPDFLHLTTKCDICALGCIFLELALVMLRGPSPKPRRIRNGEGTCDGPFVLPELWEGYESLDLPADNGLAVTELPEVMHEAEDQNNELAHTSALMPNNGDPDATWRSRDSGFYSQNLLIDPFSSPNIESLNNINDFRPFFQQGQNGTFRMPNSQTPPEFAPNIVEGGTKRSRASADAERKSPAKRVHQQYSINEADLRVIRPFLEKYNGRPSENQLRGLASSLGCSFDEVQLWRSDEFGNNELHTPAEAKLDRQNEAESSTSSLLLRPGNKSSAFSGLEQPRAPSSHNPPAPAQQAPISFSDEDDSYEARIWRFVRQKYEEAREHDCKTPHPEEVDPSKPYHCTYGCGRSFTRKDLWIRHEVLRQPQEVWVCKLCLDNGEEKPFVGFRRDKVRSHLGTRAHRLNTDAIGIVVDASTYSFQTTFEKRCGWGGTRFKSFEDRMRHLKEHFDGEFPEITKDVSQYNHRWPEESSSTCTQSQENLIEAPQGQKVSVQEDSTRKSGSPNSQLSSQSNPTHSTHSHAPSKSSHRSPTGRERKATVVAFTQHIDLVGALVFHLNGWNSMLLSRGQLGKGTFAKVEKVVYSPTGQEYACKYHYRQDSDEDAARRFRHEADIMKQVDHSSCLVRGLIVLATGLLYLHSNNLLHNDIKPANILIAKTNFLFADFGTSTTEQIESGTRFSNTLTPTYAAPEVFLSSHRSEKSDIYSLGCVFLELIIVMTHSSIFDFRRILRLQQSTSNVLGGTRGRFGFVSEYVKDQIKKVRGAPALLSERLLDICSRMVHIDATLRPSAAEVVSGLSRAMHLVPPPLMPRLGVLRQLPKKVKAAFRTRTPANNRTVFHPLDDFDTMVALPSDVLCFWWNIKIKSAIPPKGEVACTKRWMGAPFTKLFGYSTETFPPLLLEFRPYANHGFAVRIVVPKEIGPPPVTPKYAALEDLTGLGGSRKVCSEWLIQRLRLKKWCSMSILSPLLRQAIEIAFRLQLRFIWAQSLCWDHNNSQSKNKSLIEEHAAAIITVSTIRQEESMPIYRQPSDFSSSFFRSPLIDAANLDTQVAGVRGRLSRGAELLNELHSSCGECQKTSVHENWTVSSHAEVILRNNSTLAFANGHPPNRPEQIDQPSTPIHISSQNLPAFTNYTEMAKAPNPNTNESLFRLRVLWGMDDQTAMKPRGADWSASIWWRMDSFASWGPIFADLGNTSCRQRSNMDECNASLS
ncbi:hypothetical protein NA57DRAFT_76268 [Rhizodiscina lignyota]|uniref:Protein kinase domain-containing protein n=1 Tax=Rhizodiscina lignyota TaxID=1504668 RepID=A0A9P4IIG2_9PEZI|nr:hypothetical protein NA57DRAFT_76268 [Rhizodiscina lignyota]